MDHVASLLRIFSKVGLSSWVYCHQSEVSDTAPTRHLDLTVDVVVKVCCGFWSLAEELG